MAWSAKIISKNLSTENLEVVVRYSDPDTGTNIDNTYHLNYDTLNSATPGDYLSFKIAYRLQALNYIKEYDEKLALNTEVTSKDGVQSLVNILPDDRKIDVAPAVVGAGPTP